MVVVLLAFAQAVDRLAVVGAENIQQPFLLVGLQHPVDRGQGDLLAALVEQAVEVLCADEVSREFSAAQTARFCRVERPRGALRQGRGRRRYSCLSQGSRRIQ